MSKGFVLLAEDDRDQELLFRYAWEKAGIPLALESSSDGLQVIHRLNRCLAAPGGTLPAYIILDLKMPQISGLELLTWIRMTPRLAEVPIVILSSDVPPSALSRVTALGCEAVFLKPPSTKELAELVRDIHHLMVYPAQESRTSRVPAL